MARATTFARCQRFHRVVFVHELFAVLQTQDRAVTPHRLRDEEIGLFGRMVERGGVELDELHVFGDGLGAVHMAMPSPVATLGLVVEE